MNDKKIIFSLSSLIVTAILINVIIWILSIDKDDLLKNNDDKSPQQLLADDLRESGIDTSGFEVIDMESADMIEEVIVEKNPVCSGEDFMVSVRAHNPEGEISNLNYRIASKKGNPVILKYRTPGDKKINVFVRDKLTRLDHKEINVRIIECQDQSEANLKSYSNPSRLFQIDYEVSGLKGMAGNCSYHWDFGDGKNALTSVGRISHNYGDREQKSFTSTFIAKVSITDQQGKTIVARNDITFPNVQWISNNMGYPVIPISYNRIAELKGDQYAVGLYMKNIFDKPIKFTGAEIKFRPCSSNSDTVKKNFSIREIINKTDLNANEYAEDTLKVHKSFFPHITCILSIKIKGKFPDGKDVSSPLHVTIPMSKESINEAIQNNRAKVITDDSVIERVKRAQKMLGKRVVTPDELKKLEQEGKL